MILPLCSVVVAAAVAGGLPDPSSYQAIGWLLVALGALVTALNQGKRFVESLKDKPAPGDVRAEAMDRYVVKQECEKRQERNQLEHDNFWKKLGGMERGLSKELQDMERRINKADEERTSALHLRINDLLEAVSAINERTEIGKKQ